MTYIIASSRPGYSHVPAILEERTGAPFALIERKEDLTLERLHALQPRYIFFPHWSYIIPRAIYEQFECVIFHMTDVPFGRGGSPLQNLISRGIYETRITALRCEGGLDAGGVYMKRPLSLHGNAEEIYIRAGKVIVEMITEMVGSHPVPVPQTGEVVCFSRRKPEDSDIQKLETLEQLFDYIRMLDADGYPKAFLETGSFRLEFSRASLAQGSITADVHIIAKDR